MMDPVGEGDTNSETKSGSTEANRLQRHGAPAVVEYVVVRHRYGSLTGAYQHVNVRYATRCPPTVYAMGYTTVFDNPNIVL